MVSPKTPGLEKTPKAIYYCWFGRGELSKTAKKCMESWEKYAPGYRIVRCDEDVFDVDSHPWTKAAYEAGKYAYVADYVRFWAIYNFGGVYMDLGSELVRDISLLCETCSPFSAIEECSNTANTGLIIASPRRNSVIADVLASYDSLDFSDDPRFLGAHTVNEIFTKVLETRGFTRADLLQKVGEWTLLPSSAFNPVYGFGGYHIKKNTFSVHHYSGSWLEPKFKTKKKIVHALSPFIGRRAAQILGRTVAEVKYDGVLGGARNLFDVARGVRDRRRIPNADSSQSSQGSISPTSLTPKDDPR